MLNMGFQEDVETILGAAPAGTPVQTFLFSATMPPWVREITRKFLRPDSHSVDLVGTEKMKASNAVKHKVLYCHWSQRAAIVHDLVKCYGFSGARHSRRVFLPYLFILPYFDSPDIPENTSYFVWSLRQCVFCFDVIATEAFTVTQPMPHLACRCHTFEHPAAWLHQAHALASSAPLDHAGRTIVFSETKNDANELAAHLTESIGARALHGDIPQTQRETTLKGFRAGRFSVLVATDVAARGLDIASARASHHIPLRPETSDPMDVALLNCSIAATPSLLCNLRRA